MAQYSAWVLEYAVIAECPLGGLIYGAHNAGHRRLPYAYILIKGAGHVVMVDVGYNHKDYGRTLAENCGVQDWHSPREVLAECGVSPEQVDTVFLTHSHFDHMGGIDDFPNATFYIQERELSQWIWAMSLGRKYRWLMAATDPGDVMRAVDLARQGRLVCVDGDCQDVLPGIDLRAAPDSHTWGSMYVVVRNDGQANSRDSWVFAGDLVYTMENIRGYDEDDPMMIPAGLAVGSQTNLLLATDQMVETVAGDVRRIIPPHEAAVGDVHPSRIARHGLRITQLCLTSGEASRI